MYTKINSNSIKINEETGSVKVNFQVSNTPSERFPVTMKLDVYEAAKPTAKQQLKASGAQIKAGSKQIASGIKTTAVNVGSSVGVMSKATATGVMTACATVGRTTMAACSRIAGLFARMGRRLMGTKVMTPVRNLQSARFVAQTDAELPGSDALLSEAEAATENFNRKSADFAAIADSALPGTEAGSTAAELTAARAVAQAPGLSAKLNKAFANYTDGMVQAQGV